MDEKDIQYLRQKARQFRQLAGRRENSVSVKLLEIAIELEAKASEIEARLKPPN